MGYNNSQQQQQAKTAKKNVILRQKKKQFYFCVLQLVKMCYDELMTLQMSTQHSSEICDELNT